MNNQPTIEQWQQLYDLADRIKALKPWEVLGEDDVFGVRDPETGADAFVSIMGAAGEHFAVAAYFGAETLYQFWALSDMDADFQPEIIFSLRHVQLSFEDRDTLHGEDRAIIKKTGHKYRGRLAWPMFRSYLPGYLPWRIDATEARIMIHVLEQTLDVATRAAQMDGLLEPPTDETYLIRTPEVTGNTITWRDQLVEVLPPAHKELAAQIDASVLQQVKKLPRRKKSALEMEFFPMPQPMVNEEGRPYLPTTLLAVDSASGMIVVSEMLPPTTGIIEILLQIPQLLAEGLVRLGYVPGTIKVQHPMAAEIAGMLQEATDWKVKLEAELEMLNSAIDFLFSALGADSPMAEDEELETALIDMLDAMLSEEVDDQPDAEQVRHRGPKPAALSKGGKAPSKTGKASAAAKASEPSQVYQLKITLKGATPPIWRRVLVPDNLTLNQLHHVIQVAMGWYDAHLHEFSIDDVAYGTPGLDYAEAMQNDNKVRLTQVIGNNTKRFRYTYDFGDDWVHVIDIEKMLPYEPNRVYPVCLAGKRACPPEDVGGIWGYQAFLETLNNPSDPNHEGLLEWIGGGFDAEEFDIEEVNAVFARMRKR